MKRNTKKVGDVTATMVAARLLQAGYVVLMPIGDNERYDIVIDDAGSFKRVQCKTGRLNKLKTAIFFDSCSTYSHQRGSFIRKHYRGSVEFFGVYCEELDKVYLVPVENCGVRCGSLRLAERYKIKAKAYMARDFEVRKNGRVAEGTAPLTQHTLNGIVGSNPTSSAII